MVVAAATPAAMVIRSENHGSAGMAGDELSQLRMGGSDSELPKIDSFVAVARIKEEVANKTT